ncbi:hypothetical protein RQP46_001535 [Phenoliferia psychrophenolica]
MLATSLLFASIWAAATAAPLDVAAFSSLSPPSESRLLSRASAPVYPSPNHVSGNYSGIHDPSIVKTPEGGYLIYGSGGWTSYTGEPVGLGIPTWSSPDRVAWKHEGTAFAQYHLPADTVPYTNSTNAAFWAPDVSFHRGEYWMYYSASFAGQMKSAVMLARSKTGLPNSWSDEGIIVATGDGCDWNAIDPSLFVTEGRWYLSVGSYWTGIKIIGLNPETGRMLHGPNVHVNCATGLLNGRPVIALAERVHQIEGIEGSYIRELNCPGVIKAATDYSPCPAAEYHAPYFYLFSSWGSCCRGPRPTYNIRVVRSKSLLGPYEDESGGSALKGMGTEFLMGHDDVVAPGGQSESFAVLLAFCHYEERLMIV